MEIAGLQSTVNSAVFGMKEKMLKTALLGGGALLGGLIFCTYIMKKLKIHYYLHTYILSNPSLL